MIPSNIQSFFTALIPGTMEEKNKSSIMKIKEIINICKPFMACNKNLFDIKKSYCERNKELIQFNKERLESYEDSIYHYNEMIAFIYDEINWIINTFLFYEHERVEFLNDLKFKRNDFYKSIAMTIIAATGAVLSNHSIIRNFGLCLTLLSGAVVLAKAQLLKRSIVDFDLNEKECPTNIKDFEEGLDKTQLALNKFRSDKSLYKIVKRITDHELRDLMNKSLKHLKQVSSKSSNSLNLKVEQIMQTLSKFA